MYTMLAKNHRYRSCNALNMLRVACWCLVLLLGVCPVLADFNGFNLTSNGSLTISFNFSSFNGTFISSACIPKGTPSTSAVKLSV